ncbi:MAG: hypothetical protein HY820_08275 [Acidobacteria bacterium]|nr:hypothetical protein [Acidobacteriota bacterium]
MQNRQGPPRRLPQSGPHLSALMDSETARDSVRLKAALAMLNRPDSWILPEIVFPVQVRRAESVLHAERHFHDLERQ